MSMILYNVRYRGPYEYDKFVLDIFQACNETKRLQKKFRATTDDTIGRKKQVLREVAEALGGEKGLLQEVLLLELGRGNI